MTSYRILKWCFVVVVIELATLAGNYRLEAAPDLAVATSPPAATAIKELRQKAADRRRRLIFNNDGNDATRGLAQVTAKDLLDERTSMLAGTQVDCISYCPQSVGLDVFTHFTKVGTIFTAREDMFAKNQMQEFIEKGIDPLRVMCDFGKQHDIEVFFSMRMNDTHDGSSAEYGRVLLQANRFKAAHPEYLLGTRNKSPKHGAWTALDYGRPEVRERAFQLVEEVCRNYDVDGVELDFFRHPVFFKSTSIGEQASDEERSAMTEMMARIRKMADEVGQERGRPILIAVRTPDSVGYCRAIGLDLERWMAEDLIDLYIPSGYFQLNEWDYSVALGRKYGVKVYPSLDDSRLHDEVARTMRTTTLAFRARAADAWQAGADGIYLFNFPDQYRSDDALLREMGSPQTLAGRDKDYFGSIRGMGGRYLPYASYVNLETLNPDNPRKIEPGTTATAKLSLGEDEQQAVPANLKLRLKVLGVPTDQSIQVALNSKKLEVKPGSDDWFESVSSLSNLRAGRNTIAVKLPAGAERPATWSDVLLEVRHSADR